MLHNQNISSSLIERFEKIYESGYFKLYGRKVFQLIREQGLSHQEAAEILNISTHTIKRHMQEALRTLRSKFPAETLSLLLILSQWRGR